MNTTTLLSGNKCGHCPSSPRFYTPPISNKVLPSVLETAKRNLIHFYHEPSKWLLQLKLIRENRSNRRIRSESREAVSAVLGALLQHTDLKTLTVGRYDPSTGLITPIKIETISSYAGISFKRCMRVMRLLQQCGYLKVERKCHFDAKKNSHLGLSAIKKLTLAIFIHLGVSALKIERAQKYAKNQTEKLIRKTSPEKESFFFPPLLKLSKLKILNSNTKSITNKRHLSEQTVRKLLTQIQSIKLNYPDKPPDEIRRLARMALNLNPSSPEGLYFE